MEKMEYSDRVFERICYVFIKVIVVNIIDIFFGG